MHNFDNGLGFGFAREALSTLAAERSDQRVRGEGGGRGGGEACGAEPRIIGGKLIPECDRVV